MNRVIKELTGVWQRDGLFYEKVECWKLGEDVFTKRFKLFCINYWLLKKTGKLL